MSVLIMMPTWSAPSELWMERMIEAIEPDVKLIASPKPKQSFWKGRIPTLAIRNSPQTIFEKILDRLGYPIQDRIRKSSWAKLVKAVNSTFVKVVLVHYIAFALRYEKVWSATSKPLFVHCHGYDVTWDLRHHDRPSERVHPPDYTDQVLRLAKRATLIANSETTAQCLTDLGIPKDRVIVKYLGVPISETVPHQNNKCNITILYLGRLTDCKGPDLVIRAFELACDRGLDGRLIMAGDGKLRITCELLRARSKYCNRIELLGAVDAQTGERLRKEADIFTAHNCKGPISHQEEAFGVSIVEAMGAGLPVVSARNGSLPELIKHRQTGILVEPEDVEEHAEAFLELAANREFRHRIGKAAWAEAGARFSIKKERAQLREILGLVSRGIDTS